MTKRGYQNFLTLLMLATVLGVGMTSSLPATLQHSGARQDVVVGDRKLQTCREETAVEQAAKEVTDNTTCNCVYDWTGTTTTINGREYELPGVSRCISDCLLCEPTGHCALSAMDFTFLGEGLAAVVRFGRVVDFYDQAGVSNGAPASAATSTVIFNFTQATLVVGCTVTVNGERCTSCGPDIIGDDDEAPPESSKQIPKNLVSGFDCWAVDCTNIPGQGTYNSCTGDYSLGGEDVVHFALFGYETIPGVTHQCPVLGPNDMARCPLSQRPSQNVDATTRTTVKITSCYRSCVTCDTNCGDPTTVTLVAATVAGWKGGTVSDLYAIVMRREGDEVCFSWYKDDTGSIGTGGGTGSNFDRSGCQDTCVELGDQDQLDLEKFLFTVDGVATNSRHRYVKVLPEASTPASSPGSSSGHMNTSPPRWVILSSIALFPWVM